MRLATEIFRECDIRDVFGQGLDVEAAEAIGRAFGTVLDGGRARPVVCGHDNRASSEALYEAAIRGLRAAGRDLTAIGLAITPMMYFAVHHLTAGVG